MVRDGAKVLNLTVGDFNPENFPIPRALLDGVKAALDEGHTNYPPPSGMPECREAVQAVFRERLGLDYPLDAILVGAGARPMIAGTYMTLLDPGDRVVYSVPSWNNNHYSTMCRAERVEIPTTAASHFFPRADDIVPVLRGARLVSLCTPLNPTGTVMAPEELERLCRLILDENRRRERAGEPSLYLMFDQVYWMLTYRDAKHVTPVGLVPEMARYTVFVDGISKAFAATGLRVGWAVGPSDVIERMAAILTHIGAWAPRAEQVATARLLRDAATIDRYQAWMKAEILARLDVLADGMRLLRSRGHDVDAIPPEGAIYLSLRVNVAGRKTPGGETLASDEDIRGYLLHEAGVALVPFQAFGMREDTGWFRASAGAVSKAGCEQVIEKLGQALGKLS
jgi:aspartate aminotransferase